MGRSLTWPSAEHCLLAGSASDKVCASEPRVASSQGELRGNLGGGGVATWLGICSIWDWRVNPCACCGHSSGRPSAPCRPWVWPCQVNTRQAEVKLRNGEGLTQPLGIDPMARIPYLRLPGSREEMFPRGRASFSPSVAQRGWGFTPGTPELGSRQVCPPGSGSTSQFRLSASGECPVPGSLLEATHGDTGLACSPRGHV